MIIVLKIVKVLVDRLPPNSSTYIAEEAKHDIAKCCLSVSLNAILQRTRIFIADVHRECSRDVVILLITVTMFGER